MKKIKVIYQDAYGDKHPYEFNTQDEANAFIEGASVIISDYSCDAWVAEEGEFE